MSKIRGLKNTLDKYTLGVIPPFCEPAPQTENDLFARRGVREMKRACEIFGNFACPVVQLPTYVRTRMCVRVTSRARSTYPLPSIRPAPFPLAPASDSE